MKRMLLSLGLCIVLSSVICKADMTAINKAPETYLQPIIVKAQDLKSSQDPKLIETPVKPVKSYVQKMENENWDIEDKTISKNNLHTQRPYDGFLAAVSPGYTIRRGFLSLAKTSVNRNKQSLMFVFFMNSDKKDSSKTTNQDSDNSRARVHVLWPGSKKMNLEQRVIKNEYPVDVSIANYEDGYAPQEWNLVLPTKKPRKVSVSLMWSF